MESASDVVTPKIDAGGSGKEPYSDT